jgi:hypothetical protein
LPDDCKAVTHAQAYPVELSRNLLNLMKALKRQLTLNEIENVSP